MNTVVLLSTTLFVVLKLFSIRKIFQSEKAIRERTIKGKQNLQITYGENPELLKGIVNLTKLLTHIVYGLYCVYYLVCGFWSESLLFLWFCVVQCMLTVYDGNLSIKLFDFPQTTKIHGIAYRLTFNVIFDIIHIIVVTVLLFSQI